MKLKDAYRKKEDLLTSAQIGEIRAKYGISQSDLCLLLGWGGKTITRYESHQVQDRAHDTILKKIDQDPEWFLPLLNGAKENLSLASYKKYLEAAASLYEVPCEEVDMGETNAYHFSLRGKQSFSKLSNEEKDILDAVIEKLGKMSKNEIINFMHKEQAYVETAPGAMIQFKYAESLQI